MNQTAAKFREGETVILSIQGPTDDGIARLAVVSAVGQGVAWVEGRRFPLDAAEPWDIPTNPACPIRYVLKRDTPANRRALGIG